MRYTNCWLLNHRTRPNNPDYTVITNTKRDAQRTSLYTARVPDNLRNPRFYCFFVIG